MDIFRIYREVAMQTVVRLSQNNLLLRLPQRIVADLGLEDGSIVSISVKDHALIVRPVRKQYRLAELLARSPRDSMNSETDWGHAKGWEEW
jgi:antitoxin component of MazEF toxin-antitoxin module